MKYIIKPTPQPTKSSYDFKIKHTFKDRQQESSKVLEKYPDKIPVILERGNITDTFRLTRTKFLFPNQTKIGEVILSIRKHIQIHPTQAIFLFINNQIIPANHETIGSLYEINKDQDGFLYINICLENTFG
jgi:GABA(A) receptor-associated protein